MRPATISFLTCAFMASTVIAANCTKGLYYCGAVLLSKGNYAAQIDQALRAAGQPTDANTVNNSLFFCTPDGNTNGNINYVKFCQCGSGCKDGGGGNSDYCTV